MKDSDYQAGSVRQLATAARTAARVLGAADAEVKNKAPAWIADVRVLHPLKNPPADEISGVWIAGVRVALAARSQTDRSGVRACRNWR